MYTCIHACCPSPGGCLGNGRNWVLTHYIVPLALSHFGNYSGSTSLRGKLKLSQIVNGAQLHCHCTECRGIVMTTKEGLCHVLLGKISFKSIIILSVNLNPIVHLSQKEQLGSMTISKRILSAIANSTNPVQ